MRSGYGMAGVTLAAMLAVTPALAQVTIGGDNNGARHHQYQAEQAREAGRQEMAAARRDADEGRYDRAQWHRQQAHQDFAAAHDEDAMAQRDADRGLSLNFGR